MASEQAVRIGARLRERREELGLTRRQLARQMEGLATENDLYRWESGKHKPQDDTLAAIAQALGRDYAWAMGLTPGGTPPDLEDVVPRSEDDRLSSIEQRLVRIEAKLSKLVPDDTDLAAYAASVAAGRDHPVEHVVITDPDMGSGATVFQAIGEIRRDLDELVASRREAEAQLGGFDAETARDFLRVIQELQSRQGRDVGKRELQSRAATGR